MIRDRAWAGFLLAVLSTPPLEAAAQDARPTATAAVSAHEVASPTFSQETEALSVRLGEQLERNRIDIRLADADAEARRLERARLRETDKATDLTGCTPITRHTDWVGRFNQGDLSARECAIRLIQFDTFPGADYDETRTHVGMLQAFYARRAQRQQTFLDVGSLVTAIGAAGAFQGGLSDSTRRAWVITGVLPSIVGRFNSYEPTRELFQGGALAIHLITLRHDRFNRALSLLADVPKVDCTQFDRSLQTVATRRAESTENANKAAVAAALATRVGTTRAKDAAAQAATLAKTTLFDPDGVLLAEARRLRNTCYAVQRRAQSLTAARNAAEDQKAVLANDFANDVLSLDRALVAQDRDLRQTPIETLTAVVASPLRAVDALITGDNSKVALDSLKTQIAFSGVNRSLATIPLPALAPAADAMTPVAPLSPEASMLVGGSVFTQELGNLRTATDMLAEKQHSLIYQEGWATDLFGAAAANYLTFTYDAATGTTTVTLGAPPAPATLSATTATP